MGSLVKLRVCFEPSQETTSTSVAEDDNNKYVETVDAYLASKLIEHISWEGKKGYLKCS